MPTSIGDATYWRERAREARAQAARISDDIARKTMLRIAEGYQRIAERAEARERVSSER